MRKIIFLLSFFFLFSCTNTEKKDILEDFFKSYNLDKRTTYIQLESEGNKTIAETIDQGTAALFLNYLKNKEGNKIEVVVKERPFAYVKNSVSNSRSKPKHSAELSTQYLMGQKLKVIDTLDSWYYVQGPDRYLSWIDAGGILLEDEVDQEWLNAPKKVVQINELSAKEKGTNVTDLVFGNRLGDLGGDEYITPQGKRVNLQPEVFQESHHDDKNKEVLEKAFSLMGRPYLWGGTSTKGMDCSGFTRIAFMNAGHLLGRDASLQVHEGAEVDKDKMSLWQPGDLLFFGNLREDGSQRITHVAIHTENGEMIHASEQVRVESLNPRSELYNEERANSLLRVKRIF